jgi:hypothetical protein
MLLLELGGRFIHLRLEPRGLIGKLKTEHVSQVIPHRTHSVGEFMPYAMRHFRLQFRLSAIAKPHQWPARGFRECHRQPQHDHHPDYQSLTPASHLISSLIVGVCLTTLISHRHKNSR